MYCVSTLFLVVNDIDSTQFIHYVVFLMPPIFEVRAITQLENDEVKIMCSQFWSFREPFMEKIVNQ